MPAKVDPLFERNPSGPPPPYAYVPIDPFKPSLAFSLNNVLPQSVDQDAEAGRFSLHDPPPNARTRMSKFEDAIFPTSRKMQSSRPVQISHGGRRRQNVGQQLEEFRPRSPDSWQSWRIYMPSLDQDEPALDHDLDQLSRSSPPTQFPVAPALSEERIINEVQPEVDPSETGHSGRWFSACKRCKTLKVKCDRESSTSPCNRCLRGGHECIIPGRKVRGGEDAGTSNALPDSQYFVEDHRSSQSLPFGAQHSLSIQPVRTSHQTKAAVPFWAMGVKLTGAAAEMPTDEGSEDEGRNLPSFGRGPGIACKRCKGLKVKCEYSSTSTNICKLCAEGGHECLLDTRSAGGPRMRWKKSKASSFRSRERPSSPIFSFAGGVMMTDASRKPSFSERPSEDPEDLIDMEEVTEDVDTVPGEPVLLSGSPAAIDFPPEASPPFTRPLPHTLVTYGQPVKPAWRTVRPRAKQPVNDSPPQSWYRPSSERSRSQTPASSPRVSFSSNRPHPSPLNSPEIAATKPPSPFAEGHTNAGSKHDVLSYHDDKDSPAFSTGATKAQTPSTQAYVLAFLLDTVPRQVYLHMHLRLPHLYFSRVTRIFEEAEMSMPMIRQGILDAARAKAELGYNSDMGADGWAAREKMRDNMGTMSRPHLPMEYWEPPLESVAYTNLQNTWHGFIDSLQKEWKTLNIISVLLLTAILTILQIPSAAADPLTRYSALLSMICALMSLLYGCVYIIRFGTMRKTYKGAEWAEEAQRSRMGIFWNVWVLLAMPATWLAWSMILYIVTIMSFVWRTTPVSQPNSVEESSAQILIPRIIISLVVALGVIYFILITTTLRRYGEMMDRAWQMRIWGWMRSGIVGGANEDDDMESGLSDDEKPTDGDGHHDVVDSSSWHLIDEHRPAAEMVLIPSVNAKALSSGRESEKQKRRGLNEMKSDAVASTFDDGVRTTSDTVEPAAAALVSTFIIPENKTSLLPLPHNTDLDIAAPVGSSVVQRELSHEDRGIGNTNHEIRRTEEETGAEHMDNLHVRSVAQSATLSTLSNSDAVNDSNPKSSGPPETDVSDSVDYIRLFGLSSAELSVDVSPRQDLMERRLDLIDMSAEEWNTFKEEALAAMPAPVTDITQTPDHSALAVILDKINTKIQSQNSDGMIFLCKEFSESESNYAFYYISSFEPSEETPNDRATNMLTTKASKSLPYGLKRLDVMTLDRNQSLGSEIRTTIFVSS